MSLVMSSMTYGSGENAVTVKDEQEKLFAWRLFELHEAGLQNAEAAQLLAHSRCDLHQACKMIEQGCSAGLLLRILL